MSDDIKRYDPDSDGEMWEHHAGDYVEFSEHERAIHLLEMQLSIAEAYREDAERMVEYLVT